MWNARPLCLLAETHSEKQVIVSPFLVVGLQDWGGGGGAVGVLMCTSV